MEARIIRTAAAVVVACAFTGAAHRTENFTCNAPTREIAVSVCEAAERFRRDLAIDWIGYELPKWAKPCPITVQVGPRMGAGGATSFVFDHGDIFGWQMSIQGTLERVLDSVLPHEVTHTIFASHFRQPLPRWADEGACTTVEHASERMKQQKMLIEFLHTGRGISFAEMFAMREYPQDVLPLYAQGHSLAIFLIDRGGKKKYVQFVADGLASNNWPGELKKHYDFPNLGSLQNAWLDWVAQGSPPLPQTTPVADARPTQIAAVSTTAPAAAAANQPASPATGWTSTSTAKRTRPQPNLVYEEARPTASATAAVPASTTIAAVATTPTPMNYIGPGTLVPIHFDTPATHDPFVAQAAATQVIGGASRPQQPETPRQIILEWTKTPGPILDASSPGGTLRR